MKEYDFIFKYQNFALSILASILLALAAFFSIQKWEEINKEIEFTTTSQSYANAIKSELHTYREMLYAIGDIFQQTKFIDAATFQHATANTLDRHQNIQGFSWSPLISDQQRPLFENEIQQIGFSEFTIQEQNSQGKLTQDSKKKHYLPVVYISPFEENQKVLGFNLFTLPGQGQLFTDFFLSNEMKVTGKLDLTLEAAKHSVLLILPVKGVADQLLVNMDGTSSTDGALVESINMDKLMRNALSFSSNKSLRVLLIDSQAELQQQLLNSTEDFNNEDYIHFVKEAQLPQRFHWQESFDYADKKWKIVIFPKNQPAYFVASPLAWLTFIFILMLFMLVNING